MDAITEADAAAILAALPLRPRSGLRLEPIPGATDGALLILAESSDPEDSGADAIIGLAVPMAGGGWYLGCSSCRAEISEADAGMCVPCRQDTALRDLQERAAQEWPEDC